MITRRRSPSAKGRLVDWKDQSRDQAPTPCVRTRGIRLDCFNDHNFLRYTIWHQPDPMCHHLVIRELPASTCLDIRQRSVPALLPQQHQPNLAYMEPRALHLGRLWTHRPQLFPLAQSPHPWMPGPRSPCSVARHIHHRMTSWTRCPMDLGRKSRTWAVPMWACKTCVVQARWLSRMCLWASGSLCSGVVPGAISVSYWWPVVKHLVEVEYTFWYGGPAVISYCRAPHAHDPLTTIVSNVACKLLCIDQFFG